MKPPLKVVVWLSVAVAIMAFFLPWAKVELIKDTQLEQQVAAGFKRAAGKTFKARKPTESWTRRKRSGVPIIPTRVSGFQVPILANRKNVKVAADLVALFTKKRDAHIGLKSYAVYLVPGIALLAGMLLTVWGASRPVVIGLGILCTAVAVAGCWTILTTDLKAMSLRIEWGLWMSLLAYVGLAFAALVSSLPDDAQERWLGLFAKLDAKRV